MINDIELIEGHPAMIAQMLIDDKVDMGLIPVAAIPLLAEHHIVTDYCIGAEGPVASVCLFSEVPMDAITKVYLDYQSRTSVNLAKILLRDYWKKDVELMNATGEDFRDQIKGTSAGVVIGDRALEQRLRSPYIYDLAEAWLHFTGLPFVFAAWISNKKLPENFIRMFNEANAFGLSHLEEVVAENSCETFDLLDYYTRHISYPLTDQKRKGLKLFLEKLKTL